MADLFGHDNCEAVARSLRLVAALAVSSSREFHPDQNQEYRPGDLDNSGAEDIERAQQERETDQRDEQSNDFVARTGTFLLGRLRCFHGNSFHPDDC
jgi:hypothetical protein